MILSTCLSKNAKLHTWFSLARSRSYKERVKGFLHVPIQEQEVTYKCCYYPSERLRLWETETLVRDEHPENKMSLRQGFIKLLWPTRSKKFCEKLHTFLTNMSISIYSLFGYMNGHGWQLRLLMNKKLLASVWVFPRFSRFTLMYLFNVPLQPTGHCPCQWFPSDFSTTTIRAGLT
jgi:hypothetical protein